jgi:predicted dehydrogenase
MTYNALVVGCGAIGSELDEGTRGEVALSHAAGYELAAEATLVAGVEPDPDRRSAFSSARDVPGYADLETAFAEHNIDIISVCTPAETHAEVVNSALDNDAEGILCEKPIATETETAEAIVSDCRSADTVLGVNYFRRSLPGCRLARAMLRRGLIGDDRRAVLTYNKGFLNNGSHIVDLARWWFGDLTELQTTGSDAPDAIATFGQTPSHLVHAGNFSYSHVQVDVYGDRGRLQLLENGRRIRWQTRRASPLFEGFSDLGDPTDSATGFDWMCYFAVTDLITAIEGSTAPACSGEQALQTLQCCERFLD